MARQTNGTNQSLETAATINLVGVTKLSISWWMYWDSFANDDDLAWESSVNFNSNPGGILCDPNSSSGSFAVGIFSSGADYNTIRFPRPSAAAWHNYVVVLDLGAWATSVPCAVTAVYVDGISQSLTGVVTSGSAPSDFGNYKWYFMSRANASLFGAGRIAEFALWSGITLTQSDATALSGGSSPRLVRPASIPHYWPIVGATSPEIGPIGGTNLTVNSATAADHCRIVYPAIPSIGVPSSIAGKSPNYYYNLAIHTGGRY